MMRGTFVVPIGLLFAVALIVWVKFAGTLYTYSQQEKDSGNRLLFTEDKISLQPNISRYVNDYWSEAHCFWIDFSSYGIKCVQAEDSRLSDRSGHFIFLTGALDDGLHRIGQILSSHEAVALSITEKHQDQNDVAGHGDNSDGTTVPLRFLDVNFIRRGQANTELQHYTRQFEQSAAANYHSFKIEQNSLYAYHTLAPYRARVLLPETARFVYTLRQNPIDAHIAQYLKYFAIAHPTMQENVESFAVYVKTSKEQYKVWQKCRSSTFHNLLVPNSRGQVDWMTIDQLYDPAVFSWETAHMIEQQLQLSCGQCKSRPKTRNGGNLVQKEEYFAGLLSPIVAYAHGANLRRWVQAVGRKRILCLRQSDVVQHPHRVKNALAQHLGLRKCGWGDPEATTTSATTTVNAEDVDDYSDYDSKALRKQLYASQLDISSKANQRSVDRSIERLSRIYKELEDDYDAEHFLDSMCPALR